MTFSPRRVHRAAIRYTSLALVIFSLLTVVTPLRTLAASAPKIVSVDVTGNVHVPTDAILGVLEAKRGETYNPKLVQDDLARLNALGYFGDVAPPLVRQRPGGIAITYRVIENPVITKILFNGNGHVPSDTLLALMDTSVGQVFNTNTFKQDVLKINSYYEKIGYGGQVASHVKDLNLDPQTGTLTLQILEGLTVRNVIIGGDPVIPAAALIPKLGVKAGQIYSDELRDKDADTLRDLYDKAGLTLGNFIGGIDPSSIDLKNDTADVKYDVYVARVAAVQITGNTKTKDQVIRRELRLRPGMIVTQAALRRDYDRLNNTGFFSKVDVNPKPGPDPKHPEDVVLDWNVTEQKTASAQIGFGYSGGLNGEGLYGTLGYQDNNLHGTGNGTQVQFQKGANVGTGNISLTIPYVGNTPKSQKYSFSAQIFTNNTKYYYPAYLTGTPVTSPIGTTQPIPVTLYSSNASSQVAGIDATSIAKATGITATLGRRLNDITSISLGATAERIVDDTTVPSPYFFPTTQTVLNTTSTNLLSTVGGASNGLGITATSIANINTGTPYSLTQATIGALSDTRDDYFNPSRGTKAQFTETISAPALGSSFQFSQTQLDLSKFVPVRRSGGVFAAHILAETSTGAIPPSSLFTFSDQQVRGYDSIFYATDAYFGQLEYRQPVTPDRKLTLAFFVDQLDYRIRGADPILDPYTNRALSYPGDWSLRGDYGFGIRFDVPQLGLHTVRIDIAKGANGTHTSFGIGQSF